MSNYYWCTLKKGTTTTMGYIEERGAKLGTSVELIEDNSELWEVVCVSEQPVSKEYVRSLERKYKQFQGSTRGGGIDE
jgi:hypothetical protein